MSRVATRRLIDASAALDAADRALLNIWVSRGLDDAALARMTGMPEGTIADRRARVVEHLSAVLGLPPEHVRAALDESAGSATAPPRTNGAAPTAVPDTAPGEAPMAAGVGPETASSSGRRRWPWAALSLFVLVVAVVLVVSLTSNGSGPRRGRGPASRRSASASASATHSHPAQTVSRAAGAPLVALPGAPTQASGTVTITRTGPAVKLNVSVSNLPPASHGHYEVWLYDSLVYSEPLGRLRAGVKDVLLRLPANARRFHWIDISFQPVGHVFASGQSVLRSANPLFATATARHS